MPILDYTTTIAAEKTASQIVAILARHGATNVMMDYEDGKVAGIAWRIDREPESVSFRLPVNIPAVYSVLTNQRVLRTDPLKRREQAERTGWRILKNWIDAQMALLETEQVELEQIFLPYMLSDGATLYEVLAERDFRNLPVALNA